jgi:hypothetical protein
VGAKWQRDLERAWDYRNTIVLCGNIRDLHPYGRAENDCAEILDLDDFLKRWAAARVTAMRVYDQLDRFREVIPLKGAPAETPEAPEPAPSPSPQGDLDAGSRPAQASGKQISSVEKDVSRIAEYLGEGSGRLCIIQFAEQVAAKGAADPDSRLTLVRLEKLIHDMAAGNHLVLVYLFPSDIPDALHINESRAVVIEIPQPERSDVRAVLSQHFGVPDEALDRAVNACDGLTIREIARIAERLGGMTDVVALEAATRLYKFGEDRNYWAELTVERLKSAERILIEQEGIRGQDEAIRKVATVLVRARADIQRRTGGKPSRPRGALFFAGPTGVGKTMTAEKLAKFLFGRDDAFLRFDMSEYGQEFQVSRLYGAPPGYVGHDQGGALTTPLQANPFRVILFDEIDKADKRVFDIFLQILDDGRLTDSKGNVAHFSESFIIFTCNIGADADSAEELESIRGDSAAVKDHFTRAVEGFFHTTIGRPELLNRIGGDNVVVFNYIESDKIATQILTHQLEKIVTSFNGQGDGGPRIVLEIDVPATVAYLVKLDAERIKKYGGREIENLVNERIRDPLAMQVLEAEAKGQDQGIIRSSLATGELKLDLLES